MVSREGRLLAGSPAIALLVTLLIASCSDDASLSDRIAPPTPGNPAPAWAGVLLDGDSLSLGSLRGEVVVLNVWATWCVPCVREMPALEQLHQRFRDDGLRVIAASIDRRSAEPGVRDFAAAHGISFQILLDPDQRVLDRFRTIGVPETFLIDREGIINHRWIGEFEPLHPDVITRVGALLAGEGT
jgi:cytochrome c-type biogenesis protein